MRFHDILPQDTAEPPGRFNVSRLRPLVPVLVLLAIFGAGLATHHLLIPAPDFPSGKLIEIPDDALVGDMGALLEQEGVIRSSFLFKTYARVTFQDRDLASGPYVFDKPIGLLMLVHRMANGEHGIVPARVTLTEGMTVADMAGEFSTAMPGFDTEQFLQMASTSEGYLFPDTYFFTPGTTPVEAITRLRERFDDQFATVIETVGTTTRSTSELVIMASLLEREAQSEEDMRNVADILWKRLDIDMPLQVDAVFGYIRGENGYEPTLADLEIDSPYNTYLYPGLPAGPISNPGLVALTAAASPTPNPYFYYLTGRDGKMYYGVTFEDHVRNRELYLD